MGFTVDAMDPLLVGTKTIFLVCIGLFVLEGLLIFSVAYLLKQVHYWAAMVLLIVVLLISALSMRQEILSLVSQLAVGVVCALYGYFTQKNLSHWGRNKVFVALIITVVLMLSLVACGLVLFADFFSRQNWKDLVASSAMSAFRSYGVVILSCLVVSLVLVSIYFVIFLRLIAFDTQRTKNIDLNMIKTDSEVARAAVLLCALTLFLDFSLSIFRVLLPWVEKK